MYRITKSVLLVQKKEREREEKRLLRPGPEVFTACSHGLLGKDHPPSAQNLSVYRAARRNHLARPSTRLSVSRPASRRPHRRQSPVDRHRHRQPPTHPLQFPAESSTVPPPPADRTVCTVEHSPTARMRNHHTSVTTPSPLLLEDPDLDLTAPTVDHVAAC